jgi:hypothetical protein
MGGWGQAGHPAVNTRWSIIVGSPIADRLDVTQYVVRNSGPYEILRLPNHAAEKRTQFPCVSPTPIVF